MAEDTAHDEFPAAEGDAQRALGLRLRDLYATKDTSVSLALSSGVNLTWLSEQTGVHESTLLKHYGTFVHTDDADRYELAKIDPAPTPKRSDRGSIGHRLATEAFRTDFPLTRRASLTVPSWNQILQWLREMDLLRKAEAA